jgi:YceI-like domain
MSHHFGPDNARLTIRTARSGAAAKAGHDLLIVVRSWEATLDLDPQPALNLVADSRSCHVLEGTGGIQSLGDDDRTSIVQTIDEEVLKGCAIAFRSTIVKAAHDGRRLSVEGELELAGRRRPITFELAVEDSRLVGRATVTQSDFGIKPYSTLFGTLKVADQVQVAVEGTLDQASL